MSTAPETPASTELEETAHDRLEATVARLEALAARLGARSPHPRPKLTLIQGGRDA